jgi:hypothetical protein
MVGCGAGRGRVSGRVLYAGAPLPGGRVTFRPADPRQNSVSAELDEQGNYEAVLPAGEVKVCIDNHQLEPHPSRAAGLPPGLPLTPEVQRTIGSVKPDQSQPKNGENVPRKPPGTYVKIPDKYRTVETSGLQFVVEGGNQTHEIELTK